MRWLWLASRTGTVALLTAVAGSHALSEKSPVPGWVAPARLLLSEDSSSIERARARLVARPDLDRELAKGLGHPGLQGLALTAIASLKRESLLPALIHEGRDDPTGVFFLTANALVSERTESRLAAFYRNRLSKMEPAHGSAPKVAMLGGLKAMKSPLGHSTLRRLVTDPSFEVRLAAVDYAGFMERNGETAYPKSLVHSLDHGPYQVRLRAIWEIAAMRGPTRRRYLPSLDRCRNDKNDHVRRACRRLRERASGRPGGGA